MLSITDLTLPLGEGRGWVEGEEDLKLPVEGHLVCSGLKSVLGDLHSFRVNT